MFSDETRFGLVAATGVALAVLAGCGAWLAISYLDSARLADANKSQARAKTYRRTVAENLRVTRHGIRGVDFIRCGKCRMEKRRQGIFTLGGMNVLVLEDLSVVLPREESDGEQSDRGGDGVRSIVQRMGVTDGFLKERGLPMKFSGLKISNLSVSRLSKENHPEMAFSARSAEAVRGGLKLSECMVHESGCSAPISVSDARLVRADRKLRLSWRGGAMDLN